MSTLELFKSRHADMGIIWIFATLGRQSRVRSLSKKAIAQVNIQEACRVVAQPEHPLPLRISSQFMAGLARVYVSQADVWVSDVTAMHANVRRVALATLGDSDAIDLPRTARTVRKETITFQLPLLPEALFEFERAVDVPSGSDLASRPERKTRSDPKHIVSQDKITLPPRVSLMDDQSGDSLLFASELGTGLLNWDPNDEQSALDLGLFSQQEQLLGFGDQEQDSMVLGPDVSRLDPADPSVSFAPLFSGADWTTSREDGIPSFAAGPGAADDMPGLEDMSDLDQASRALLLAEGTPGAQPLFLEDSNDEVTWEAPFPVNQIKRSKSSKDASGPMVDFAIEVPERALFQRHTQYTRLMARLQHEAQVKADEKQASITAKQYLDGHFDSIARGEALGLFWNDMLEQAKHTCGNKTASRYARGTKRDRLVRDEDGTYPGQGDRGMGPGANEDLPPMDDMPPLEHMPNKPMGGQALLDGLPPLDDDPIFMGGEASMYTTSDVGVARDARSTGGSHEARLPWNMPHMLERLGSDVLPSLSRTPSRSDKPAQRMPWIGSHSQPSPLPFADHGTPGDISDWDPQDPGKSHLHDIDGLADTQARIAHRAAMEADQFARYVMAVARSLPAPPVPTTENKYRSLFFSDVAPVAEASPAVAAQAFYHVLSLVTARKMKVRQHEPYTEVIISLPDPEMTTPAPRDQTVHSRRRNSLTSPRDRGTGSRSRSGTSASGGRGTHSRDTSFSAYLSVASPGTAA